MATISIADNDARVQYTQAVTADSTQLTIDFPFFSLDDIKVIVTNSSSVDTALTRGTGAGTFAVNGTSVDDGYSGGNVTLGSSYDDTNTYTIYRDITVTRTTDFPTSGPFNISSLNTELDKLFAISQELQTSIGRKVGIVDSDGTSSVALPAKATRLGKILGFNSSTGVPEMFTYLTNDNVTALNGLTAGTVTASKFVLVDANKDIGSFRNLTLTGELDCATLDVSGNADIDGTLEADAITIDGVSLAETISDTVGAMVSSNTETGISVTYDDSDNTLDFVLGSAQTTITSLLATDIKIGEDDETKIDFETADQINFYANNVNLLSLTNANSGDAVLTVSTADKNFTIKGTDGSSAITPLDIDMALNGKATFSGDVVVGGDLTITGDDLVMGTNTSGHILVADGTNYNPVAVSGDISMAANGAVTIANDAVESGMLNDNVISGQTELASGLADTDELLVSDAGTVKRMDLSVVKTYLEDAGFSSEDPTALAIALG